MGSHLLPDRTRPIATPASRRRGGAVGYLLRAGTAAALTVDAVVHLRDAGCYDSVATAVLSQGALFRAEAAAALLIAALLGPLPDMFEPTWTLPGKAASAYAEVAGTVLATAGLVRDRRRRPATDAQA